MPQMEMGEGLPSPVTNGCFIARHTRNQDHVLTWPNTDGTPVTEQIAGGGEGMLPSEGLARATHRENEVGSPGRSPVSRGEGCHHLPGLPLLASLAGLGTKQQKRLAGPHSVVARGTVQVTQSNSFLTLRT